MKKYRIDIYDVRNPYEFKKRFYWHLENENQAKALIQKFLKHSDYKPCWYEVNRVF